MVLSMSMRGSLVGSDSSRTLHVQYTEAARLVWAFLPSLREAAELESTGTFTLFAAFPSHC